MSANFYNISNAGKTKYSSIYTCITQLHCRFGFVSYSSDKAAAKAKKRTNGVEINNQKISVDFTVTNESKNQLILVHLSPSVTEKAIREYFKQNLVSVKIMKKDIDSHNYRARNAW